LYAAFLNEDVFTWRQTGANRVRNSLCLQMLHYGASAISFPKAREIEAKNKTLILIQICKIRRGFLTVTYVQVLLTTNSIICI